MNIHFCNFRTRLEVLALQLGLDKRGLLRRPIRPQHPDRPAEALELRGLHVPPEPDQPLPDHTDPARVQEDEAKG